MAKNTSTHLLLPGETAWEIWAITGDNSATLHEAFDCALPSEITKYPAGDLIYLFPVRGLTAVPLMVNTGDLSLFEDLAATHAERLGLRPDPFAGQLSDIIPVAVKSDESTLLSIILRSPSTEELPTKSPKAFDISARSFQATGNRLTLWRELGQWVFAIHQEGKLLYCQATTSSAVSPDQNLIREIRIAIAQLSMQGIAASPAKATVWTSNPETDTSLLSHALSTQTELSTRPAPTLPQPLSKLLPADVRAARKSAQKRQNTLLAIAALGLLYLGTVAYFGYGIWKTQSTTDKLITRTKVISPQGEIYETHIAKWDELEYAISREYNTVDILDRIAKLIPANSGLRLKTAVISPTEITLIGEAPQPQAVNQFSLNLTRSNNLLSYEWTTPEPKQSNRGWEFRFNAIQPTLAP